MKHARRLAPSPLAPSLLVLSLAGTLASGCSDRAKAATASGPETTQEGLTLEPSSAALKFVKIEELVPSDAAPNVSLTGRITFDEDRTQRVATPIDGRATAILVKLGDRVKPGQSLIELSSPQVGQLQADAQKTQQDLMVAQKTVDRVHKLKVDGAVSEKEVGQAEADLHGDGDAVGQLDGEAEIACTIQFLRFGRHERDRADGPLADRQRNAHRGAETERP
jgi:cobalt-zinc-cadmium efflux system membrane fusion protein